MSKMISILNQHAGQYQSVMTKFAKRFAKRGINEIELIGKLAQPESELALDKIADVCVDLMSGAESILKEFFKSGGSIKLWFGDNFKNWILSGEIVYVERKGKLIKNDFPNSMTDEEIIRKFKIRPYDSKSDVLSEIRDLILKQPNGEKGELLTDGFANIFYVKLKNGDTVAVGAFWRSVAREWLLPALRLGVFVWAGGDRVFSRS